MYFPSVNGLTDVKRTYLINSKISQKPLGYMEPPLFTVFYRNGGGIMRKLTVRWVHGQEKKYAI